MAQTYTIDDVVRMAIVNVAGGSDLGVPLVFQWTEQRYREITSRLHLQQLRVDGELSYQAPLTNGTVSVVNGSNVVTGTGTSFTNQQRGWFFRYNTNWYRIDDVQPATQTLYLHSPYVENTAAVSGYVVLQRFIPLDPDCRWVASVTHPRLFRRLLERNMEWLDSREAARILVAAFPTIYCEGPQYFGDYAGTVDPIPGRDNIMADRRKTLEIYPYSTQQEFFRYLYWKTLPPVQLNTVLAPEIDHYMLFEGVKASAYEWLLNNAMKGPNKDLQAAALYRTLKNDAIAIWEEKIKAAVWTDTINLDQNVELWTDAEMAQLSDIDSAYDNYVSRLGIITVQ